MPIDDRGIPEKGECYKEWVDEFFATAVKDASEVPEEEAAATLLLGMTFLFNFTEDVRLLALERGKTFSELLAKHITILEDEMKQEEEIPFRVRMMGCRKPQNIASVEAGMLQEGEAADAVNHAAFICSEVYERIALREYDMAEGDALGDLSRLTHAMINLENAFISMCEKEGLPAQEVYDSVHGATRAAHFLGEETKPRPSEEN